MNPQEYIDELTKEFKLNSNENIAAGQKAYMKDNFLFFGLKSERRRELQKPFLAKAFLPSKSEAFTIIKLLWSKPEREYQLFGQELAFKYVKSFEVEDIDVIEFMIANKSWWDTVDFIAVKLVGAYLKQFPSERNRITAKWQKSGNMWLQRSAILFQLKYKTELDAELLSIIIKSNLGSKEFFINKAIGWILREYTRTNPQWVISFVEENEDALSGLSKREALRLLN